MPPFRQPTFHYDYDYDVDHELEALRDYPKRPDRAIPPKDYRLLAEILSWFDIAAARRRAPLLRQAKDSGSGIARRCLEAFAVARWADLRRRDDYSYTKNILARGDFNLPLRDASDAVYRALADAVCTCLSTPRRSAGRT